MEKTIIQQIHTILKGIKSIKSVYPYPLKGIARSYPAVVFFPYASENMYDSNKENLKTFTFKMYVEVSLSGTTEEAVFTDILPNAVDEIVQAFDSSWSKTIGSHRAWLLINGGLWGLTVENNSKVAWVELNLVYKVSNDI